MTKIKPHIVWILANSSSAPYFSWFANVATKKLDFKLSFVCLFHEEPKMIEEMTAIGCDCYWIRYDHQHRKSGILKSILKCFILFKKIKPDIIHSHLFDDSLIAMIAGSFARVNKKFVTKGDTGFHYFFKPQWVIFDKLINYLASDIIAISNESRKFIIEKEKASTQKVKLIHHGLPTHEISIQNPEIKDLLIEKYALKNKIVIGTISRFIEWKGYKKIVNAAEEIIKQNKNVVFLFIGQGEQKEEIVNIVKSKNLSDNIVFTDWIEPENIPSLFGLMDIFVHAAKYEPFGLVIAEAMLNGVPVVATKTGAALDSITHLKNGYLCDLNSTQDLVDGINYLITNNSLLEIGRKGKMEAEKIFSIELMYNKHLNIYFSK